MTAPLGPLGASVILRMGGGRSLRSPVRLAYHFAVRSVCATPRRRLARVHFLVVARLAFQFEVVRVQADLGVVAVYVVKPHLEVVDYPSGLSPAGLADASVDGRSFTYICIAGASPRLRFVKLFLEQLLSLLAVKSHPPTISSVSYAGDVFRLIQGPWRPFARFPMLPF